MSDQKQIPVGWEYCQLGEIVSVIRGVSYSKDQSTSSPKPDFVPILRATNINRHLDFEELIYVEPQCVTSEQFLRSGDIIIAASSGSKSVVGKAAHFEGDWFGSFGAFCMGLRPCDLVESRYVGYFLQSDEYRHRVSELSAGSNINNLKRDHIQSFPFRIAPILEQQRIVAKIEELFSDLDAGVAALKRAKANLKRYRAAVLKAAVEGKLTEEWRANHPAKEPASALLARILKERREKWEADQLAKFTAAKKEPPKNWRDKYVEPSPPDTSGLPQLPDGWCWATIRQLAFVDVGFAFKSTEYAKVGIRLLRGENMEPGSLRWNDVRFWPEDKLAGLEHLRVKEGQIILAMDRPLVSAGLKIARAKAADLPCLLVQRMARLRMLADDMTGFLNCSMQTHAFITHLLGDQTGTQLPHISGSGIEEFVTPLPPLMEQLQITAEVAEKLSQIDSAEAAIENDLLRATRLRQSILKQAFEGKLVPQDPSDEPASVLLERLQAHQSIKGENQKAGTSIRTFGRGAKSKKIERRVAE